MKNVFFSCLFILSGLIATTGFAQSTRSCAANDHLQMLQQTYPDMQQNMDKIEQFTQNYIQNYNPNANQRTVNVTIPVVVHVVYKSNSDNISTAQVTSQIQVLNEDFRRLNADAVNTQSIFASVAADAGIEFCLATIDPDGNPTSGITRRRTNKRSFSYNNDGVKFSSLGGTDAWPASDYLNIWVCNLGSNLLGYAQFPGGPASTDGVVLLTEAFGTTGNISYPFHLGRTTTHEVGHWLNLRHIWGDGPCGYDDYVGDTPESDAYNFGCAIGHVSCGSTDMVQNYMDYSDDACMNLYTQGQSARMNALFASGGVRESLLYSVGCGGTPPPPPTGCNVPGSLFASSITETTAQLNWSAVSGALSYNVRARQVGTSTWATGSMSSNAASFAGLIACTNYEFQVQTVCSSSSSAFSASSLFTTAGCASSCAIPSGLAATNIVQTSAQLNWSAVADALTYNLRARQVGASTWTTGSTSGTAMNFNGLTACTDYEFQVESVCSASSSGFSASEQFTTTGCAPVNCDTPTGLATSSISGKSATCNWTAVSGATSYEVLYGEASSNRRRTKTTSTNSVKLNGLKTGRTYEWSVRSICGTSASAYSATVTFVAGSGNRMEEPNYEFNVYPNPSNNIVNIELPGTDTYNIRMMDLSGKVVVDHSVNGTEATTYNINVSQFAPGIYYIQLSGNTTDSLVKKLVVY